MDYIKQNQDGIAYGLQLLALGDFPLAEKIQKFISITENVEMNLGK